MILSELIKYLQETDPALVLPHGFTNPHSYRGYYDQLAFEPARDVTVASMLAAARSALDATYQGYKGGDFTMTGDTDCWLANYGALGEEIGPTLLRLMLAAGKPGRTLRDRLKEALEKRLPCPKCDSTQTCRCHVLADAYTELRLDALMQAIAGHQARDSA